MCLQDYWENKNDSKVCDQIKSQGSKFNCIYYFNHNNSYEGLAQATENT